MLTNTISKCSRITIATITTTVELKGRVQNIFTSAQNSDTRSLEDRNACVPDKRNEAFSQKKWNVRSRDTTGPGSAAPFAAEEEGRATQTDSHSTIFELLDLLSFSRTRRGCLVNARLRSIRKRRYFVNKDYVLRFLLRTQSIRSAS